MKILNKDDKISLYGNLNIKVLSKKMEKIYVYLLKIIMLVKQETYYTSLYKNVMSNMTITGQTLIRKLKLPK